MDYTGAIRFISVGRPGAIGDRTHYVTSALFDWANDDINASEEHFSVCRLDNGQYLREFALGDNIYRGPGCVAALLALLPRCLTRGAAGHALGWHVLTL